jgi:membrane-bound lytic murein transglycosylase A
MTSTMTYEAVDFASLPGWADDDHVAAFRAYCGSAEAVMEASTGRGDEANGADLVAKAALDQADQIGTREQARAFFEARFEPHRVVVRGGQGQGRQGLLTGYYEPVIDGSLTPTERFAVPVYRRPPDLVNVVAESARAAMGEGLTHLRRTPTGTEPYATREDIERGGLAGLGLELCYLADPVETFFLHIQGSGAIRLPEGRLQRITYDGKNGHPYTSIGRTLIDDGTFTAEGLTLQVLGDWLRADPDRGRHVMWRNRSFVFFKALEGNSPIGVMGTRLFPGRSMAVDPAFHALGMPVYVAAPSMTHVAPGGFNRLMVAHDVGSAIKGPARGDLYFGTGPDALAYAGITKHVGTFFVLQPVAVP